MHIYAYRYIYRVFHSSLLDDIVYRMNYRLSTLNFTSFNLVLFGFQAKLEWMDLNGHFIHEIYDE